MLITAQNSLENNKLRQAIDRDSKFVKNMIERDLSHSIIDEFVKSSEQSTTIKTLENVTDFRLNLIVLAPKTFDEITTRLRFLHNAYPIIVEEIFNLLTKDKIE